MRTREWVVAAVLVACAISPGAARAELIAPAFQGVLPLGSRAMGLFRVPGSTSQWSGSVGDKVPGSAWVLRKLSMRPTQAVVEVAGGKLITLAPGETFLGGDRPVPAPLERSAAPAIRPAVRPAVRPAFPRSGGHAVNLSTGEGVEFIRQPPPGQPPRRMDAASLTSFSAFAVPGFPTAVMVSSAACPGCRGITPHMEKWAIDHGEYRVVIADIGTTEDGGINFRAPLVKANGLHGVPYFVILDRAGQVTQRGNAARAILNIEDSPNE